jgi:hypothetical protein
MKATPKNLLVLTRLEERMQEGSERDRIGGHPALTAYDLWPGERYHAERLVRLGFLKKTRTCTPWYGRQPVTLYYADGDCEPNPFPEGHPLRGMQNHRMQEKLASGEAVDLSGCPRSKPNDRPAHGDYLLGEVDVADLVAAATDHEVLLLAARDTLFAEGTDYCSAATEAWIWSIGVHRETGRVWASHRASKYRNPAFVCIWLR